MAVSTFPGYSKLSLNGEPGGNTGNSSLFRLSRVFGINKGRSACSTWLDFNNPGWGLSPP